MRNALLTLLVAAATGSVEAPEQSLFPNRTARPLAAGDLRVAVQHPLQPTNVESAVLERTLDLGNRDGLFELRRSTEALLALGVLQDAYEKDHPERVLPFPSDVSS